MRGPSAPLAGTFLSPQLLCVLWEEQEISFLLLLTDFGFLFFKKKCCSKSAPLPDFPGLRI